MHQVKIDFTLGSETLERYYHLQSTSVSASALPLCRVLFQSHLPGAATYIVAHHLRGFVIEN